MQFVMRLAREFRRADWRRMLSEMSATELGEWGDYFRMQSFSDVWMDAQFASLKALSIILSGTNIFQYLLIRIKFIRSTAYRTKLPG